MKVILGYILAYLPIWIYIALGIIDASATGMPYFIYGLFILIGLLAIQRRGFKLLLE